MADHAEETTYVAPEVWYKGKRVLRTIVQALVVLVPTVNLAASALNGYLSEQADVTLPPWVFLWLNVAVVSTGLVMGAVARLMAVPQVNNLLVRIGLGSVPRALVTKNQDV